MVEFTKDDCSSSNWVRWSCSSKINSSRWSLSSSSCINTSSGTGSKTNGKSSAPGIWWRSPQPEATRKDLPEDIWISQQVLCGASSRINRKSSIHSGENDNLRLTGSFSVLGPSMTVPKQAGMHSYPQNMEGLWTICWQIFRPANHKIHGLSTDGAATFWAEIFMSLSAKKGSPTRWGNQLRWRNRILATLHWHCVRRRRSWKAHGRFHNCCRKTTCKMVHASWLVWWDLVWSCMYDLGFDICYMLICRICGYLMGSWHVGLQYFSTIW